jgi:hypothetical protein
MIFGREPAFWIGLIVSIVLAVVRVVAGEDLISPDQADAAANATQKVADVVLLIAPLIAGLLIRQTVTPVAAPSLPAGTDVTVTSTTGAPVGTTTL